MFAVRLVIIAGNLHLHTTLYRIYNRCMFYTRYSVPCYSSAIYAVFAKGQKETIGCLPPLHTY
jgi:hypothetical protein